MDVLEKQYQEQMRAYTTLVTETVRDPSKITTNLPKIQGIQSQLTAILDKMLAEVALMKEGIPLAQRRAELIKQLQRIQKDYSELRASSDKLETLRRIRAFEDQSWKGEFRIYLILFVMFLVFVGLMLVLKRQAPDMSAMTPSSPTTMTPLA